MKSIDNKYIDLINNISTTYNSAKINAIKAINEELVKANWEIGRYIVEFEQNGNNKAQYGSLLISNISNDLKLKFGKGFSKSNIYLCRQFYLKFSIFQTVSGKLSWSHYAELLTISDDFARNFYEKQSLIENWSIRELKRQIKSALFERIALSTDKEGVLKLASIGNIISKPIDIIKDPYIFEFLEIPKEKIIKENDLEKKIINNLQKFLLELGKGFSFVSKQYKINIDNQHFYVDLVFYHRILKCFVLIDLKIRKVKHQDIGQMNLYLNYFKEEENNSDDNEPIGIIIAAEKNEYLVKYATGGLSNNIFVSKYQLYLPEQKILEEKVKEIIENS